MKKLILKLIKEKKNHIKFDDYCYGRSCSNCTIGKIRELENSKFEHIMCDIVYENIEKEIKSNINKY